MLVQPHPTEPAAIELMALFFERHFMATHKRKLHAVSPVPKVLLRSRAAVPLRPKSWSRCVRQIRLTEMPRFADPPSCRKR